MGKTLHSRAAAAAAAANALGIGGSVGIKRVKEKRKDLKQERIRKVIGGRERGKEGSRSEFDFNTQTSNIEAARRGSHKALHSLAISVATG